MTINYELKDEQRIASLLTKANGDQAKALRLASNMATTITKADKALRRCRAAEDVNAHEVAAIFYDRCKILGGDRDPSLELRLAGKGRPLTKPEPDLQIKVRNISFSRKEKPSDKPRIYFWDETKEASIAEMFMQRYTPREVFLPHIEDILEPLGMTRELKTSTLRNVKVSWSQHAGCSCPCSPGFIVDNRAYGFDIHVNYSVVKVDSKRRAS